MRIVSYLFTVLGIVGIGVSTPSQASAQMTFAQMQQDAELACEAALKEDTIEALEEYLRKYPLASTACRALAQNALGGFGPSNQGDSGPDRTSFGDGNYGG